MRITIVPGVALLIVGAWLMASSEATSQPGVIGGRCLHDSSELPADRARREQARLLAREINTAEARAVRQSKRYQPLSQLGPLPETPSGFVVRLHTDGEGYIFSIKDDRDACRYGVFSDQQGTLYEASPTLPLIAS